MAKNHKKSATPEKTNFSHILDIEINNFRRFSSFSLKNIGQVNILLGPNNVGKSSLMEAIFAFGCGFNFGPLTLSMPTFRLFPQQQFGLLGYGEQLLSLFNDRANFPYTFSITAKAIDRSLSSESVSVIKNEYTFSPSSALASLQPKQLGQSTFQLQPFEVKTDLIKSLDKVQDSLFIPSAPLVQQQNLGILELDIFSEKSKRHAAITLPPTNSPVSRPTVVTSYHDFFTHRLPQVELEVFSYIKREKLLSTFVNEMQTAFPGLKNIDHIPHPNGEQGNVFIDWDNGTSTPLFSCGDGLRRWFYLLGQMVIHQNSIHCIEEVDATFHPDAQQELARNLFYYAKKYNNQLFMACHNIEFVDNALKIFSEDSQFADYSRDFFKIHTLKPAINDKNLVEVWTVSGREAHRLRSDYSLELR